MEISKDDVVVKSKYGRCPLVIAVKNGHDTVVRLLPTVGGANPSSNCLFQAVEQGNQKIIKLLLGTGKVDPNLIDDCGQIPILLVEEYRHKGTVNLLSSLLD